MDENASKQVSSQNIIVDKSSTNSDTSLEPINADNLVKRVTVGLKAPVSIKKNNAGDVFEFEDGDEDYAEERLREESSDEDGGDDQEEPVTRITTQQHAAVANSNVLRNRSSNLVEINRSSTAAAQASKYSCSLPRDIPFMMGGARSLAAAGSALATGNQQRDIAEEDYEYEQEKQQQENHQPLSAASRAAANRSINRVTTGSTVQEEDDEDFDVGDKMANIGEAISNLASSIVVKDGRELFGGVPSRRIPINTISQSYF